MSGQNPAAVTDPYARFKQEAGEYAVGFVESGTVSYTHLTLPTSDLV